MLSEINSISSPGIISRFAKKDSEYTDHRSFQNASDTQVKMDEKNDLSSEKYEEIFIEGFSILSFKTLNDLQSYSKEKSCENNKSRKRAYNLRKGIVDSKLVKNRVIADCDQKDMPLAKKSKISAFKMKEATPFMDDCRTTANTVSSGIEKQRSKSVDSSPVRKRIFPKRCYSADMSSRINIDFKWQDYTSKEQPLNNESTEEKLISPTSIEDDPPNAILSHPKMIESLSRLLEISTDSVKNLIKNPTFLQLYRISLKAISYQKMPIVNENNSPNNNTSPLSNQHNNLLSNIAKQRSFSKNSSPIKSPHQAHFNPSPTSFSNRLSNPISAHTKTATSLQSTSLHQHLYKQQTIPSRFTFAQAPVSADANMKPLNLSSKSCPNQPLDQSKNDYRFKDPKHAQEIAQLLNSNQILSNKYQHFNRNVLAQKSPTYLNNAKNSIQQPHNMNFDELKFKSQSLFDRNSQNDLPNFHPVSSVRFPANAHITPNAKFSLNKRSLTKWCDAHVKIAYNIHFASNYNKKVQPNLRQSKSLFEAQQMHSFINVDKNNSNLRKPNPSTMLNFGSNLPIPPRIINPMNIAMKTGLPTSVHTKPTINQDFIQKNINTTHQNRPIYHNNQQMKPLISQSNQMNRPTLRGEPFKYPLPSTTAPSTSSGNPLNNLSMHQYYQIFNEFCKSFNHTQGQGSNKFVHPIPSPGLMNRHRLSESPYPPQPSTMPPQQQHGQRRSPADDSTAFHQQLLKEQEKIASHNKVNDQSPKHSKTSPTLPANNSDRFSMFMGKNLNSSFFQ